MNPFTHFTGYALYVLQILMETQKSQRENWNEKMHKSKVRLNVKYCQLNKLVHFPPKNMSGRRSLFMAFLLE